MVILKAQYEARGIRIDPRAPDSADPKELVAYDLRVGKLYQEPADATIRAFPKKGYTLKQGQCIVIYTLENVAMSHDLIGILCSKASLTAKGLVVANTKVDPGFNDILKISIVNAGRRPIKIEQDMRFCSIVFHTLEHQVPAKISRKPPELPGEHRSWASRRWDDANSHPLFVAFVSALLAALFTLGCTIIYEKYIKQQLAHDNTIQPRID